jgi:hypothetical protein
MTPEDTLSTFFAEAAPPSRDLGFEAVVAERIARRRAIATVGALIPWTIAAITLCWALGPLLAPFVLEFSRTLAPAVAILALTALGVALSLAAGQRLRPI